MWQKLKQHISKWQGVLITAPTVAGLVIATAGTGSFQLLEWATLDQFFQQRPQEAVDPRILVITIDESDITQIGTWPIPDQVLAQLLRKINAQQPRAIGLDLYRDLPVEPGHQELVEVFQSTPNLIGVEKVVGETVAPSPTLKQRDQVAMADLVLDADGKVRRGLLSVQLDDESIHLGLGVKLALMYLDAEGITLQMTDEAKSHLQLGKAEFVPLTGNEGGYVNADVGGYQILLNYRGPRENFQTVSIADILENRISADLMRDRIVLIGATGQSANDLFFTPYSQNTIGSRQQTPGVIIHANIASQIISGAMAGRPLIKAIDGRPLIPFIDRINQLSWLTIWIDPVEWLWIVVWSFIGAGGSWKLQQANQFADRIFPRWMVVGFGTFFMGSILVVGSYGAFLANWWLPVVSPMAALIGSSMAIALYQTWELQLYNADLEILLETTTAHSDAIEEELHQQAEEAARESERRLAQFLEAVPVGVAVLDARGKTYYLNQRAQQLIGKGVVPDTFAEQFAEVYQFYMAGTEQLYPAELLPVVQALMGESATADDIEIHQGDQIIPIEAWGIPIFDEGGQVTFAIAAFQDITERKKAEAERKDFTAQLLQLNQAYERFVPENFLQLLDKKSIVDVKLGEAVQKEMSILFSDIRSFTTLSERMSLEDNFKFINAYLSRMEPAIVEHDGFIDKYIGDAIMALFNGSADDAVRAGIDMLNRLTDYNKTRRRPDRPPIQIGIGINTGSLMLGTVGGHNRMDGTVISDAVNLAARLEQLTKEYGVSLLISHHTFLQLTHPVEYAFRIIGQVQVKGKIEMVSVFEIFEADPPEIRSVKLMTKPDFEKALFLYTKRLFKEAAQIFQECLDINPVDQVAQIYLDACQKQGED